MEDQQRGRDSRDEEGDARQPRREHRQPERLGGAGDEEQEDGPEDKGADHLREGPMHPDALQGAVDVGAARQSVEPPRDTRAQALEQQREQPAAEEQPDGAEKIRQEQTRRIGDVRERGAQATP
jgi:hypothetical protein